MSTLKIVSFTEDARLDDLDLVPFLRTKIQRGHRLDFSGVIAVKPAFLDALFDGMTPEDVDTHICGVEDKLDVALGAWVDRVTNRGRRVRTRDFTIQTPPPPRKKAPPIERDPTGDERFTPTRLVQRLKETLRGYIESAYPLSDPTLVRARRRLLDEEAGGRLLAQEPYIETTTRYAASEFGYGDLGLPEHLGAFLASLANTPSAQGSPEAPESILYPRMYAHQARAFQATLVEGRDVVVATGTGSGKTECFLVPMLGRLYDEAARDPASFARPGVRALVLYPMNALVNDQLARLRLLLGDPAVSSSFEKLGHGARAPRFGMYTGRTPYPGPRDGKRDAGRVKPLLDYYLKLPPEIEARLRRMGRYPAKDLRAFLGAGEAERTTNSRGRDYTRHHWERRLHTGKHDRELLTRQEMVHGAGSHPGHCPDVLITNYSMLEYMLMRPFERPIFDETRRWLEHDGAQLLLVLDEAHMYRGAKGAEVAFLIRRLRARLGIHDRPDKLRVIATSASLGSDTGAIETVKRFAADVVGKSPDDFDAVTGTREVPTPAEPAPAEVATMLAALDLDAISEAMDGPSLRSALAPLLPGEAVPGDASEQQVLAALHATLADRPWVNQVVKEAAGHAIALSDLAAKVFPDHAASTKALEALLTVGSLARRKPEDAGLIPTRVHGLFRGLHGLYACVNPCCSGRQSEPGERALLGRLHASPTSSCEACGCRVFEIASCRSCGSPYLYAYAQTGQLDRLAFLWGETEGALCRIELLPNAPRYAASTETLRFHMRTGYVDVENRFEDDQVREVAIWLDGDGRRHPTFEQCAMCQSSGRSGSRIHDFRTRGEQPFTALIEAQFAEQPPQKSDPRLPNHGRKVLVFSDGRQKAARLAPALEHSHARDLFRQVLALGAQALADAGHEPSLQHIYATVVHLCAHRGYNLFPAADESEFRNQVGQLKGCDLATAIERVKSRWIQMTRSYAQALFSELTDRYYSLPSLALATLEETSLARDMIFRDFPDVGLTVEAQHVLFRAWLRQHFERRSFRPPGAAQKELGDKWAIPVGIDAANMTQVLPYRFRNYLARLLDDEESAVESVALWFQRVVRDSGMLAQESDLYFLTTEHLNLVLRLDKGWLRCLDCGRIHPEVLSDLCPACLGKVVEADADYLDARTGFYRRQVQRAFDPKTLEPFGLSAAEHSAQLTGGDDASAFNKVEEYELRFQDVPLDDLPPIDVLSCTTTMEVGIDIGALSGVALRNVPPQVANYQQRAGRAGRRGRSIASVITYAHGTSHDAHFFDHPADIISGNVLPPVVYVENQQVLERHIHAYLVQRFFHERVPPDPTSYGLAGSLGTVAQFLSDTEACSLRALESWLDENTDLLKGELNGWVPRFSHGLNMPIQHVAETVEQAVPATKRRIREVLPLAAFDQRENLTELERESLERSLGEPLLQTLIGHAVFPRYAFPTDVVAFWVARKRRLGSPATTREFEYEPQRDLQVALTEYAPGRSLTIDKWRFESAALYSPFEPAPGPTLSRRRPYTSCADCSWATITESLAGATRCPVCKSDRLTRKAFIRPAGFAPDLNAQRVIDRGQPITYAGMTDRARLEPQDPPDEWQVRHDGRLRQWTGPRRLVMVNKGVGQRGFRVCPDCGRAEPEFGQGFTATKLTRGGAPVNHQHPLEEGRTCPGVADGPFFLGHDFPTDALLLRLRVDSPVTLGSTTTVGIMTKAARVALTSLVEALAIAASRVLQIDEGELSGWWTPIMGGPTDEAQLYLYDLLPGGAGYARAVGESLDQVLGATEALLAGCDCKSSCYRCIRHYGNHWIHASLDRHLARDLLHHIRTGAVPELARTEKEERLRGLEALLSLRQVDCRVGAEIDGTHVPMIAEPATGPVYVDVHHALTDHGANRSSLHQVADDRFVESISLDAFTLVHDLPEAVRQLELTDVSTRPSR